MKSFVCTLSKKGLPCLWEAGGGMSNTGHAVIITDPDGAPKQAIYVRRSGSLSCGEHALVPIAVGDHVIMAGHHRRDFTIMVYRVDSITKDGDDTVAECARIHRYDRGEWDSEHHISIQAAIDAACNKATCYHCRSPFYVLEPTQREAAAR